MDESPQPFDKQVSLFWKFIISCLVGSDETMARTRPIRNLRQSVNTSGKSGRGVQKRRKSVNEDGDIGRGRKNTWRLPWLKKLVVLRLCGLHFSEIFEILSILSHNTTPRVKRTAQHRMQTLFGKEWKTLCASDKDTTKGRLQVLLATEYARKKRRGCASYKRSPQSNRKQSCASGPSSEDHESYSPLKSDLEFYELFPNPPERRYSLIDVPNLVRISSPEVPTDKHISRVSAVEENKALDILGLETPAVHSGTSPRKDIPQPKSILLNGTKSLEKVSLESQPEDTETLEAEPQEEDYPLGQPLREFEAFLAAANGDAPLAEDDDPSFHHLSISIDRNSHLDAVSTISRASTYSKISDILKGYGRSVSERSLIKRAVSMRYSLSLSSLATSLNQSLSEASSTSHEITDILLRAYAAQDTHRAKRPRPPVPLILQQQATMRADNWALIKDCCSQGGEFWSVGEFVYFICIHQKITQCTFNPSEGFSARDCSLGEFLDSAGRTELFFAAGVGAPLHVLLELIRHSYGHINACDKENRTFMFYLDPRILLEKRCGCEHHKTAFECLIGNLQVAFFDFYHVDDEGRNFLDFLCLSEHFHLKLLTDLAKGKLNMTYLIRKLAQSRDNFGLSFLDRLSSIDLKVLGRGIYRTIGLEKDFLFRNGRTQVHNLLLETLCQPQKDDAALHLARALYEQGANLDSKSACGTTPLIFATKNSYPSTVQFLLSVVGCSITAQDSSGRSALDYTIDNFNKSRKSKISAPSLVNPLKTLIQLADYKVDFRPPSISPRRLVEQMRKDRSIREITDYSIFDRKQPLSDDGEAP
ncbi:hypothetical protein DM02DRAFT_627325 [Periconia macrospinosa]|uniref:Uncharacterized protein n=1 Tax=Periconia macrospinosa TaxID=97972 RepID=A0A2V1DX12_9PLEO|nr:hypothetical protein DM02DRAFT_627325 [Periconia macrospinosa]